MPRPVITSPHTNSVTARNRGLASAVDCDTLSGFTAAPVALAILPRALATRLPSRAPLAWVKKRRRFIVGGGLEGRVFALPQRFCNIYKPANYRASRAQLPQLRQPSLLASAVRRLDDPDQALDCLDCVLRFLGPRCMASDQPLKP